MDSKDKLAKDWLMLKDDYKLKEIIGKGAFGVVLLAKDRKTKQQVAIKFIETQFDYLITCRNVIREISLLRQLKL